MADGNSTLAGEGDPDLLDANLVVRDSGQNQQASSPENGNNIGEVDVKAFKFKQLSPDANEKSPAAIRLDAIQCEDNDLKGEIYKWKCLAKAIQDQSESFIHNLLWEEGILPDQLIAKGCLTSEENANILKTRTGNMNQMRVVLVLLLSRDFKTLLAFLGSLLESDSGLAGLAGPVIELYDRFIAEENQTEENCAFCQMKAKVHVSFVTDKLWKKALVDNEFVGKVSRLDVCLGGQDHLWDQIARNAETAKVLSEVLAAVEACGFHSDIAAMIQADQGQGMDKLECRCGPRMALLKPHVFADDGNDSGNGLEQDELEFSSGN